MSYSGLRTRDTVWSGKWQIPCKQRWRLHGLSSSDLGTRVLEKCLYFSRRGQGGRISSHNTRHMCQRHNQATIPWGEGTQISYSVTPHSRFWALGTWTWWATMVQRKPTFAPPASSFFLLPPQPRLSWVLLLPLLPLVVHRNPQVWWRICSCCCCHRLFSPPTKVCECYSVDSLFFVFSSFYRLDLHNVTCVAWAELRTEHQPSSKRKSDLPLISLWLLEVRVSWFREWSIRSSQLCPVLSVLNLIKSEAVLIQSFLSMCLFNSSCSLITPNHAPNQIWGPIKKGNKITPTYLSERQGFSKPVLGVMHGVVDFFRLFVYWRSCYSIPDPWT